MFATPRRSRRGRNGTGTTRSPKALPSSTYPFPQPSTPPKTPKKKFLSGKPGFTTVFLRNTLAAGDIQVPHDVLLQIFEFLPIEDLFNILRVCKQFADTLSGQHAGSLWRKALDRSGCPPIPHYVKPFDFAVFLFRIYLRCQICKAQRGVILENECVLLRLLCRGCLNRHFKTATELEKEACVSIDPQMLELVPSIATDNGPERYSIDHFLEVDAARRNGKASRILRRKCIYVLEFAETCRHWITHWNEEKASKLIESRLHEIKARLLHQGLNDYDFDAIKNHTLVAIAAPPPQNQEWDGFIFPELVPPIVDARNRRMFEHRPQDIKMATRIQCLQMCHLILRECVEPQLRRTFPDLRTVARFEICRDKIVLPDTIEVGAESFDEGDILREIQSWLQRQRSSLADLCLSFGLGDLVAVASSLSPAPSFTDIKWPLQERFLELALAQFTCRQCERYCPTYRTALVHLNNPLMCTPNHVTDGCNFSFFPSKTTVYLLHISGLPMTTTADRLDDLDMFWRCLNCPLNRPYIGDWRGCATHERAHSTARPKFERASRQTAMRSGCYFRDAWECAHCNPSLAFRVHAREELEAHVRKTHQVRRPKVPDDLFWRE
ncbi:hypothetical protein V5O48_006560 [Marasmius crinis-equi]|uniref:F-box domain-containing protein n=1 Tax=Marasmius crinis-equi TaxID=585013 RepID=A0ABR3FJK1_9AGAR